MALQRCLLQAITPRARSYSVGSSTANKALLILRRRLSNETTTAESSSNNKNLNKRLDHRDREWIPPKQPLAGDKGRSHQYSHVEEEKELKQIEKELREIEEQQDEDDHPAAEMNAQQSSSSSSSSSTSASTSDKSSISLSPPPSPSQDERVALSDGGVDWLKTRRAMLSGSSTTAMMMKPDDAVLAKQQLSDDAIPVKHHTLLNRKEIVTVVEALGGYDVQVVLDNPDKPRMGGANGIMIVTVSTFFQMRNIAETLVRQLRRRKLQQVGVVGAELGVEGNLDDPNETWMVVDCGSYVVHMQDEKIRRALDLEGLWSGRDGMHKVNLENDDEVEDYVAKHPVPDDYWDSSAAITDWDETLKVLEKSRWTRERRPTVVVPGKKRKRKGPKKKG